MIKKTLITMILIVAIASVALVAGQAKVSNADSKEQTVAKAEHANFEGTLVCLGCSLKKGEGARAACKASGHTHALKTKDGRYVNFLTNQYSEDLLKGEKYHNKEMKVHGIYHASANILDVESFNVDGKDKSWCGHCKSMDACMAKSGK